MGNYMTDYTTSENKEQANNNLKSLIEEENNLIQERVLKEMNEKYAYIGSNIQGYLVEGKNPRTKQKDFSIQKRNHLICRHENDFFFLYDSKTKETELEKVKRIKQNKIKFWLTHPDRREYDNIIFDPTIKNPHISPKYYNIFKGYRINPKKGDCSMFLEFVSEIICRGNRILYEYILNWMAHLFQYPEKKLTALILKGGQGIGKGTFANVLGHIMGSCFLTVNSLEALLGRFDGELNNKLLVHGDEATMGSTKKDIGKLKSLVTEDQMRIEFKGINAFTVDNNLHFIFSSNAPRPIPIEEGNRRFVVIEVSERCKEDINYFTALKKSMEEGGYEALMHFLMERDLEGFNVWKEKPVLIAEFEQFLATEPIAAFFYEILCTHLFDFYEETPQEFWYTEKLKEKVYECYTKWAEKENHRVENHTKFGMLVRRFTGAVHHSYKIDNTIKRKWMWESMEQTRNQFQKVSKADASIWPFIKNKEQNTIKVTKEEFESFSVGDYSKASKGE